MKQILSSLFLWFYRLDMLDAAFLILALTVLFLLVRRRLSSRRWWKCCLGVALIGMLFTVAYTTIFDRVGGEPLQHNFVPFHSYREVQNGGNVEIYRSNFLNAVLFYPTGLLATSLLPQKWPGWYRCFLVALTLTVMSTGIEFLQYHYALGRCEIDDVIHNAIGALLGSLVFVSSVHFYKKKKTDV